MPRPDHPLQDETRLRFLTPRPEPDEGLTTVSADLSAFFVTIDRVGRNEALLLLVAKALRQRTGLLALRVNDLAWMLRVSNRRVIRWLDRLVDHRFVVYHIEDFWGIDTVNVEIIGTSVEAQPFDRAVRLDLPTHWFVQVLPLMGRTTFAVYLYLLSREQLGALHVDHLVGMLRLRGRFHAHWHLRRLRKRELLKHGRDGIAKVADPPPPSRHERLVLRFLAIPLLRRRIWHIAMLAGLVIALVTMLLLIRHISFTPRP